MSELLERAKALVDQITPGKWTYVRREFITSDQPGACIWAPMFSTETTCADGEFIAAAPDVMRELIAELERIETKAEEDSKPHCPHCGGSMTNWAVGGWQCNDVDCYVQQRKKGKRE